jgi:hypothetical protein
MSEEIKKNQPSDGGDLGDPAPGNIPSTGCFASGGIGGVTPSLVLIHLVTFQPLSLV